MQVNTEKTELALKAASTEVSLFVENSEAEVKALEDKYLTLVPNASTKEGYQHCKNVRAELMPIKSNLEAVRKTLKAPVISMGKLIDSSINPLGERVEKLYKPFESAYRAVDEEKKNREAKRQEIIQKGFNDLDNALVTAAGSTSSVIEAVLDDMADFSIDRNVFMEKSDEAAKRHTEVMNRLGEMLVSATQMEEIQAKQAEIEAREKAIQEKEQAETEKLQREQELKAEAEREKAAEQARIERDKELATVRAEAQEQAKKDAEIRHAQELKAAEERAKQQAEQARKQEQQRQADELAAKQAVEAAREADREHKASIHNAILESILTTGITEEQAKAIIKLAATRNAASMYIQY